MADRNTDYLEFYEEDLGDGLTQLGDIYCHYPLLSVTDNGIDVAFEYEKFYVYVSYSELSSSSGKTRTFEGWRREYK